MKRLGTAALVAVLAVGALYTWARGHIKECQ